VAVFIADAGRHRHRDDAAEQRRPEGVDERLVARQEQDQLVARPRAQPLQAMQNRERTLVELAECDAARLALAFQVGDRARHIAIGLQQLGEGAGGDRRGQGLGARVHAARDSSVSG